MFNVMYTIIFFCLDLNYLEETADGPDVTIAAFPSSERLVYIQVCDTVWCHHMSCKPYSFMFADGCQIACR